MAVSIFSAAVTLAKPEQLWITTSGLSRPFSRRRMSVLGRPGTRRARYEPRNEERLASRNFPGGTAACAPEGLVLPEI